MSTRERPNPIFEKHESLVWRTPTSKMGTTHSRTYTTTVSSQTIRSMAAGGAGVASALVTAKKPFGP
jgi:hypothetical protein